MASSLFSWLADQSTNLKCILLPPVNVTPTASQILLGSTVGIAGIVTTDLVLGYKRFLTGNAMTSRHITQKEALPLSLNSQSYTPHFAITKTNSNAPPFGIAQSSTMLAKSSFCTTKPKTFKPKFLKNKLSVKDWLFQYFYQTRLNMYANIIYRSVNAFCVPYSRRNVMSLNILGKTLIEFPSFHTMIDAPNLHRHNYVLNKLGLQNNDNIIFFSDVNVWIQDNKKKDKQLIEFIEICCEITADNECIALFWRVQGTKFGYVEMGDANNMSIEEFMNIIIFWAGFKVHALCHIYGNKIILKTPKNMNEEMKKIYEDFRTAEVSMTALNHVARTISWALNSTDDMVSHILDLNSLNMVWKHSSLLQNELLANMRVTGFLIKARKKLLRMFSINKLHGIFDFEAAYLCIVCHGIDHDGFHNVNNMNFAREGLDLWQFVFTFGEQNKPILRESRLKYLAKSKMLQGYSNYLESIDSELSDCVYLINSG